MARKATKLRKPTLKNLVILMGGEVLTRLFTFIAYAYLARTLGPTAYGYIAPSYAVLMLCMLVVDMGFGTLGTRDIARNHEITPSLVNRVMSAQLILAVGVLITLTIGCLVLPVKPVYTMLLIGLGISLLGVPALLNWVFQARNEMFLYAIPMALRQGVFLAVTVWIIAGPDDVTRLPIAEIAGVAASGLIFILAYLHLGERISLSLRNGLDRKLFSRAIPIGGAQIIWALRMYLPVVIAGTLLGADAAALFDVGHRITMVFLTFLGVYFTNLLPAMSVTSNEATEELGHLLARGVLLTVIPSVVLAFVVLLAGPLALALVYGDAFVNSSSVEVFSILAWLVPVLALRTNGRTALITLNLQHVDLRVSIVGILLLLAIAIPLTLTAGIAGTAWAMVVSELLTTVATWIYLVPALRRARNALLG